MISAGKEGEKTVHWKPMFEVQTQEKSEAKKMSLERKPQKSVQCAHKISAAGHETSGVVSLQKASAIFFQMMIYLQKMQVGQTF